MAFSSSSGLRFSLSLLSADPGLNALIGNGQGTAPVLDLRAFTAAQSLGGTLVIGREADFNSVAGFYRTVDITGLVIAADGITRLRPGDNGYAAAALRPANVVSQLSGLTVADNQTSSRSFSGALRPGERRNILWLRISKPRPHQPLPHTGKQSVRPGRHPRRR